MKIYKFGVLCLFVLLLGSCNNDMLYDESNSAREAYTQSFIKAFGLINPKQDWNMATRISAEITLGEKYAPMAENLTLRIYTSRPGDSDSRLVARSVSPREGKVNMQFDFIKGADKAYITLADHDGHYLYYGYSPIVDGKLTVNLSYPISSRDSGTITKIKDTRDRPGSYTWFEYNNSNLVNYFGSVPGTYANIYDIYLLGGNEATAPTILGSEIENIVGSGKPFSESGVTDHKCNLQYWFGAQNDVIFKTTSDGEISVDFIFANTAKNNQFGYLYYSQEEGDAAEAEAKAGTGETSAMKRILQKDRYIILDDATYRIFKSDGNDLASSQDFNNISMGFASSKELVGASRKLVYFGPDGTSEGSYTFPANTHIVFFLVINGAQSNTDLYDMDIRYSRVIFNKMFVNRTPTNGSACSADEGNKCQTVLSNAISFKWNDKIVLGFEDEVDDDMNDLLFYVNGKFAEQDIVTFEDGERKDNTDPSNPSTPTPPTEPNDDFDASQINWILACEDLGAEGDFDFNDIVLGINYVEEDNATERIVKVYPLAAGGTIPANIRFNDTNVGKEIHEMFGVSTTTMYNTFGSFVPCSSCIEITLGEGETFSLSNGQMVVNKNMGGFSITVEGRGEITPPGTGEAPQMICIPGTWKWPKEYQNISTVYPGFGEWGANYGNTEWYTTDVNTDKIINWY